MSTHSPGDLQRLYGARFADSLHYRNRVWRTLIDHWFGRLVEPNMVVLDLGAGYGEFINQVQCRTKYAMDLNPDSSRVLNSDVSFLEQDCSTSWPLDDDSLDVVFTSNFFEHLPSKAALGSALDEIHRCLRPNGRLIALGPNIKYTGGAYWDFWDHYVPLTESSMREALATRGFRVETCLGRFLPYTMSDGRQYPLALLRVYLRVPLLWRWFGKQFLVVASKVSRA